MKEVLTSNYAAAYGAKLSRVEVVAAYPITPQTSISEKLAEMVESGELDAKYLKVESEHSAMSALLGASYAGARTFTATGSQGLALMHEMLFWASGARVPVVMPVASRALGAPWSIWCDNMDVVAQRDTGWIQLFCENNQETLDTVIMAYKIAEDNDILLPTMVVEDGFILSHTLEAVEVPEIEEVDDFLPPFEPEHKIDIDNPRRFGAVVSPEWFTEYRYKMAQSMEKAKEKIKKVDKEFEKAFGRSYGGLVEFYRCDDAQVALLISGSATGTAKDVVDAMRERGKKVGVVKVKALRPFPVEEIRKLNDMISILGVFDRSYTLGHGGAFFTETRNAIFQAGGGIPIKNYIGGLGGRDVNEKDIEYIFEDLLSISESGSLDREVEWVQVKGGRGRW